MIITIKDDGLRFGVRVGAIILNKEKNKILIQKHGDQKFYVFPGGRADIGEESIDAIKRELKEELNIDVDVRLKYICEFRKNLPNLLYHEIGFYFVTILDDDKYNDYEKEYYNLDEEHDGKGIFTWHDIDEIDRNEFLLTSLIDNIKNREFLNEEVRHIVDFD